MLIITTKTVDGKEVTTVIRAHYNRALIDLQLGTAGDPGLNPCKEYTEIHMLNSLARSCTPR